MTTLAAPLSPVKPRKPARPTHGPCRLSLHINGPCHAVRLIPADQDAGIGKLVRLRKADGTTYHCHRDDAGRTGCDCPDHTFHREGADNGACKHVSALVACGLL